MDDDEDMKRKLDESSRRTEISGNSSSNWIAADSSNYFFSSDDRHDESSILSEFGWNFQPDDNHRITPQISSSDNFPLPFEQMDFDQRSENLAGSNSCSGLVPDYHTQMANQRRSIDVSSLSKSNPSVSSSCSEDLQPEKSMESSDGKPPDKPSPKKGPKRIRQARFAFMTKSDVDHLEDGYRWRKYGQKAVKNSPYPRSYYRCTNIICTVKKRVERSYEDPTIVITTYEGQHCHHTVGFQRSGSHLFSPDNHTAFAAAQMNTTSAESSYVPRMMMQFPLDQAGPTAVSRQPHQQHEVVRSSSSSSSQVSREDLSLHLPIDEGLLGDIVSAEMRR